MKVERVIHEELNFKPGDVVYMENYTSKRAIEVVRIVENAGQTYVVFSNRTWRPISTYGKTWCKESERC
jgi:hypothetical protein